MTNLFSIKDSNLEDLRKPTPVKTGLLESIEFYQERIEKVL